MVRPSAGVAALAPDHFVRGTVALPGRCEQSCTFSLV